MNIEPWGQKSYKILERKQTQDLYPGWANFSVKSQIINVLELEGRKSKCQNYPTLFLWWKADLNNRSISEDGYVLTKLY